MVKRKFIIMQCLLLAIAVLPWGDGQSRAQTDATAEKIDAASKDRLREKAERVQERMKERAAYEKWKNSKARDNAARAKAAPVKAAPVKDGKGDAK